MPPSRAGRGVLRALPWLTSGVVALRAGGVPWLSVRPAARQLEIDLSGAREAGLNLARIVELEDAETGLVRGVVSVGRQLADLGWTLTLRDGEERLLTLGREASRLTGRVRLNPLRLRRLLGALR